MTTAVRTFLLLALTASSLAVTGSGNRLHATTQADVAAQRLLGQAQMLYEAADPEGAIREATVLVDQFPASELVDDALLLIANSHVSLGNHDAARGTADRIVNAHPRTASAAAATVIVARYDIDASRSTDDLRSVRETLSRLPILFDAATFPRLEARAAAMVLSGNISLRLLETEMAEGEFAAAMEPGVSGAWLARAYAGLGTALLRSGEWEAAGALLQLGAAEVPTARTLLSLIHRHRLGATETAWRQSRTLVSAGGRLDEPIGVGASNDGELLVVDEGVPFGALLGADGAVVARQNPLAGATKPWFGPASVAYVVMRRSILAPFTRQRQTFMTRQGGRTEEVDKIVAATHGPLGSILVAHDDGDKLSRFDARGAYMSMPLGSQRFKIVDIEVDNQGRFLLLDRRNKAVIALDGDGGIETLVTASDWRRPEAMAIDALDNFYVLDRGDKRIHVYSSEGARLARLGPALPGGHRLDDPRDLAVDGSGRIYIADRGSSVRQLRTAGGGSVPEWVLVLNEASILLRAGEWEQVVRLVRPLQVPERPGVGASMSSYWLGLALSELGPDYAALARGAFEHAAADRDGRLLHDDGPIVWPLARARARRLQQ